MINKFNIAKALINKAKQVSDDNSYLLIPDGESYSPEPNDTYIEEMVLYGDDESVGIADNSSDIQFGIYQLNVMTPKAEEGGKWSGLQIAGVYQGEFTKGLELSFGGQTLRLKNCSVKPMGQTETHFMHVLSIEFSVIN